MYELLVPTQAVTANADRVKEWCDLQAFYEGPRHGIPNPGPCAFPEIVLGAQPRRGRFAGI